VAQIWHGSVNPGVFERGAGPDRPSDPYRAARPHYAAIWEAPEGAIPLGADLIISTCASTSLLHSPTHVKPSCKKRFCLHL
jgi:hypothetical protein